MKKKYYIHIHKLIVILIVLVFSFFLGKISFESHIIDPFNNSPVTYDIYDIYYSNRYAGTIPQSSDIVLIDVGFTYREEISSLINSLFARSNPKVVGIDMVFDTDKNPKTDSLFLNTLKTHRDKIVIGCTLSGQQKKNKSKLQSYITDSLNSGYIELLLDNNTQNVKAYKPFVKSDSKKSLLKPAFTSKILIKYNSDIYKRLLNKQQDNTQIEYIDFKRNFSYEKGMDFSYLALSKQQILKDTGRLRFLDNKIVLMGFLGDSLGQKVVIDRYFTPLNKKYIGKTLPDMFGLEIHANILSMWLEKTNIKTLSSIWFYLLAVLITIFNIWIFFKIKNYKSGNYEFVIRIIQIIEILVLIYMIFEIYSIEGKSYHYRIPYLLLLMPILFFNDIAKIYTSYIRPFAEKIIKHYA